MNSFEKQQRRGSRQINSKSGSLSQDAFELDCPIHALNHVFYDGEPQTRSTHFPRARFIHAIKTFENSRQIFRGNSYSGIGNLDASLSIRSASNLNPNLAIPSIKFHRVVE